VITPPVFSKAELRQIWTIARLEVRRAFLNKRAFWVYGLALFPAIIFLIHGIEVSLRAERWSGRSQIAPAIVDSFRPGLTVDQVRAMAGEPLEDQRWSHRVREDTGETADPDNREERRRSRRVEERFLRYYDGKRRADLTFRDDALREIRIHPILNLDEDRRAFAGVFQYFYLRLAIFFGCLGIFLNLFRGEMLDKTLHFWFLVPARREALLLGKYTAGLIASSVIFGAGALLCFFAMLWPHAAADTQAYWRSGAAGHLFWYTVAALAACIGYGSVFLAAGTLLRNPIIPAAVLLLWESVNSFLPEWLQKLSVLHYLQSICPIPAPTDPEMPAFLKLMLSPANPAPPALALLGLLALTAVVLFAASRAIRRLEINYSTE
jgi:hypothetical protein